MNGGDCGGSCACLGPAGPRVQNALDASKGIAASKPVLLTTTKHLTDIEVDYGHEILEHSKETKEIAITYDIRNGARWRTTHRFESGIFSAKIKTPAGNTSGLNCSFYLSSLEGDKTQDEIDFEFLGKDKGIIQTNVYTQGAGNREEIHQLGFDSSEAFHEYAIHWSSNEILWFIDGVQVRKHERKENEAYPTKPMFLYASVWNAGYINDGEWAGCYVGCDEPYLCTYKDVQIPHLQ